MYPINHLHGIHIMPFAENLVTLRRAANLTQRQLAEALDISVQQVKNYEAKRNLPTLDIIKRLAVVLNSSADELIFDRNEREPKTNNLRVLAATISTFPEDEQKTVISMLDAFVKRHKLTEMMQAAGD